MLISVMNEGIILNAKRSPSKVPVDMEKGQKGHLPLKPQPSLPKRRDIRETVQSLKISHSKATFPVKTKIVQVLPCSNCLLPSLGIRAL